MKVEFPTRPDRMSDEEYDDYLYKVAFANRSYTRKYIAANPWTPNCESYGKGLITGTGTVVTWMCQDPAFGYDDDGYPYHSQAIAALPGTESRTCLRIDPDGSYEVYGEKAIPPRAKAVLNKLLKERE